MKKIMVLVGDYWHSKESIAPLAALIADGPDEVFLTEKPEDFYQGEVDLLITFKDPIENDQIPTPIWCDEKWTELLLQRVEKGMGLIAVHAAVTDLPKDHKIVARLYEALFLTHPAPCEVTFVPAAQHPILDGIGEFTFPKWDEHYQMEMLPDAKAKILAYTTSVNGTQPALWVKEYGAGRVCMFTPGHDTPNLTCPEYVQLMKNMITYTRRQK